MFYEELMMDPQTLIKFKLFRRMLTFTKSKSSNRAISQRNGLELSANIH